MRPTLFANVLPFDAALAAVISAATPIERVEVVSLADADGRVAAGTVVSLVNVPPFDRAAMDGYAVMADDTAGAHREATRVLKCVGTVFTGQWPKSPVRQGECMEIATGAPLPEGATAVVMVEHTARVDDTVRVLSPVEAGQNIGRRGADVPAGGRILSAGDVLSPSRIGAVAGSGVATIEVFARPSVAILSTGNEVVPPGRPLEPGQIHDINQFTLAAVVRRHGGVATTLPVAADSLGDLDRALQSISGHDIAIFSGGSSVGARDLMADAVAARGEIIFHGIAVKPGKPTLFGRVGRTLVFGMPGYPASCLSNAYMLLVPLLRATARLAPWTPETRTLPLSRRIVSTPDRHQFYTVRVVDGRAEPAFKASGDITSMANADGFIEIPAGVDGVPAGTMVTVTMF